MQAAPTPSRTFLVQQAALTVLHDRYPASIRRQGRPQVAQRLARLIASDFEEGREFAWAVRLEFTSRARQCQRRAA